MISESDRGWVAAVLELKGMIIRKKNTTRRTPQLVIVVDSKETGVIAKLASLTGTKPEPHAAAKVPDWMQRGCKDHCPHPHHKHHDKWQMPMTTRWTVTGAAACIIAYNVIPYMTSDVKGFTALRDETLNNLVLTGQGSGMVRQAIIRLMGLGWAIPPGITEKLAALEEGR